MTTISASAILRSKNMGKVISTLCLRYPGFIHADVVAHRRFSANKATDLSMSARRIMQSAVSDPAVPVFWNGGADLIRPAGHDGEPVRFIKTVWNHQVDSFDVGIAEGLPAKAWEQARDQAVDMVKGFTAAGYDGHALAFLLEPFVHVTALVSATEWDDFVDLEHIADAEPHLRALATEIRRELDREDNIQALRPGQWHLPFATESFATHDRDGKGLDLAIRKAVACCASTSPKTVDGLEMTPQRATALYDSLVVAWPLHVSPFEHVCQADEFRDVQSGHGLAEGWRNPHQHGNFVGFRQYRHML